MKRTGNSKLAVVGWGRGMGHTGHMYLADAVIQQAADMKADPYFFVSKTIGKDDPIYPEEKIHIYQAVFPKHRNIFMPQGNLNQALTDLAQMGYDGVIVVVGADQKQAFQYLEKPNKEGVPVYQSMGLKKLRVISRQETRSKFAKEEGPRATPMREILMNPNASEEDKFNVWRRDMPQALNDAEVLDLMHKAEQRMKAVPTKAKKLKEFITRIRPLLKEADAKQKLRILKLIKESMTEEKSKAIGKTAKDLTDPPKVMQHRAKRDQEREKQYKNAQLRKDDSDEGDWEDTESQQLISFAQQHYPQARTKQQAFIKYVQRALKHSEEEDKQQDQELEQIKSELLQLQQNQEKLMKVSESQDYLDEK
jgi:hypothetical protein